jgi:hypothetical protein
MPAPAMWPGLAGANVPASMELMISAERKGLEICEAMCCAWVDFLGQRTRRWGALREQLGRCADMEEAMKLNSEFLTETMRAYADAASGMLETTRKAMSGGAQAPDIALASPTKIEERRVA